MGEGEQFLDSDAPTWDEFKATPPTLLGKAKKVVTDIVTPEPVMSEGEQFLDSDAETWEDFKAPSIGQRIKTGVSEFFDKPATGAEQVLAVPGTAEPIPEPTPLQPELPTEPKWEKPPTELAEGYKWQPETGVLEKLSEKSAIAEASIATEEGAKTFGKGVIHGTLGIGESIGTGLRYAGHRLQTPSVVDFGLLSPTQQAWTARRREELISQGTDPDKAMKLALIDRALDEARTSKEGGEFLRKQGKLIEKHWGKAAKEWGPPQEIEGKNVWDSPELLGSPTWWLYNIGDMAPALATTMVPALGASKGITAYGAMTKMSPKAIQRLARLGASITGGTLGGGLEATGTYRAVLAKDGTEPEAARAAELMGFFAAGLNALSLDRFLKTTGPGFMNQVKQRGASALLEGITEGAEEPAEVVAKVVAKIQEGGEVPEDVMDMLYQSFKEAVTVAPIAAVTGLAAGGAGGVTRKGEVITEKEGEVLETITPEKKADLEALKEGPVVEQAKEVAGEAPQVEQPPIGEPPVEEEIAIPEIEKPIPEGRASVVTEAGAEPIIVSPKGAGIIKELYPEAIVEGEVEAVKEQPKPEKTTTLEVILEAGAVPKQIEVGLDVVDKKIAQYKYLFPNASVKELPRIEGKPTLPTKKESKVRTLRGFIKQTGGIDFSGYEGELQMTEPAFKRLSKKGGTKLDIAIPEYINEGYLPKDMTPDKFLEEMRTDAKTTLSRGPLTADVTTKKDYEKTAEEKRVQEEMEYEPETPEGIDKVLPVKTETEIQALKEEEPTGMPKYKMRVIIKETGEEVTIEQDANEALKDTEDRIHNLRVLKDCIG